MSEHDALVERVTAIIRPLHDRPAKRGEWLSEAQIRDTARAAIAAMQGGGLEALLDENWVVTELYRCADVDPGVFYARVDEAGGGDKRFGDGTGDTVADAIRAAVEAALGEDNT